jgi:hypothetical protein
MFAKADIFNLALNELLLVRRITNADTDTSNEAKVLLTNYNMAFWSTLETMDLNATSTQAVLALVATCPIKHWKYAYQYPADCVFFRRIQSHVVVDCKATHHPKLVGVFNGQRVIFANHDCAIGEYIPNSISESMLPATAALAVAQRLAILSAPLVTGKGAAALIQAIEKKFVQTKADAQALDARENFNFVSEQIESEFVLERTSFY